MIVSSSRSNPAPSSSRFAAWRWSESASGRPGHLRPNRGDKRRRGGHFRPPHEVALFDPWEVVRWRDERVRRQPARHVERELAAFGADPAVGCPVDIVPRLVPAPSDDLRHVWLLVEVDVPAVLHLVPGVHVLWRGSTFVGFGEEVEARAPGRVEAPGAGRVGRLGHLVRERTAAVHRRLDQPRPYERNEQAGAVLLPPREVRDAFSDDERFPAQVRLRPAAVVAVGEKEQVDAPDLVIDVARGQTHLDITASEAFITVEQLVQRDPELPLRVVGINKPHRSVGSLVAGKEGGDVSGVPARQHAEFTAVAVDEGQIAARLGQVIGRGRPDPGNARARVAHIGVTKLHCAGGGPVLRRIHDDRKRRSARPRAQILDRGRAHPVDIVLDRLDLCRRRIVPQVVALEVAYLRRGKGVEQQALGRPPGLDAARAFAGEVLEAGRRAVDAFERPSELGGEISNCDVEVVPVDQELSPAFVRESRTRLAHALDKNLVHGDVSVLNRTPSRQVPGEHSASLSPRIAPIRPRRPSTRRTAKLEVGVRRATRFDSAARGLVRDRVLCEFGARAHRGRRTSGFANSVWIDSRRSRSGRSPCFLGVLSNPV